MRFNLTAAVGIAAGSIGLIAGALIPKPQQNYGMAVVTVRPGRPSHEGLHRESGCLDGGVGL